MKLKRPTKKILLVSGIVVCFAFLSMAAFYITAIFPQLPEVFQGEQKLPILSSDNEVSAICNSYQDKTAEDLYDISFNYLKKGDYKTCFNINKMVVKKTPENQTGDISLRGLACTNMGECYRIVGNTKAACTYTDIGLSVPLLEGAQGDYLHTRNKAACAYVQDDSLTGFKKSSQTIEKLVDVLNITITWPSWQKTYKKIKNDAYRYIILLYNLSPENYDYNKVIKYSQEQMSFDDTKTSRYYTIARAYLDLGNSEKALEYWGRLRKTEFASINDITIGACYYILQGDLPKARFYINLLGILCISSNAKEVYYYTSTLYYQKTGDIPKAKEYLTKLKDNNNYKVYHQDFIKLEKELGMNFDDVRAKLAQKYEEYSKISLELGGKSWEDGLKEIS